MMKIFYLFTTLFFISSCSYRIFYPYPFQDNEIYTNTNYIDTSFNSDGFKIKALIVKPKTDSIKASIFVLHGNRYTRFYWANLLNVLSEGGYQLFIMDYRGYGQSEGRPSHRNVLSDAQNLFNYFAQLDEVKNTKKIVMGLSLGGNLAIKLASLETGKFDALVTEAAFTTHFREAWFLSPFMLKPLTLMVNSPYKAQKLIRQIKAPKLIIHSTEDKTVPFKMGQQIFKNACDPKVFWQITGRHTDGTLLFAKQYIEKLDQIIEINP